jgi:predicted metal-dependent phosphoesterase TrpH
MYVATDLHGHTLFSDGRATPEAYVDFRRELGMKVVAISDHDVFGGVRRGAAAASKSGIIFVPAAEITSFLHFGTSEAEQFHVLAYFSPDYAFGPRLESTRLWQRAARVVERWRDFAMEWISALSEDDRDALDPHGDLSRAAPHDFPALQPLIDLIVARRRPLFEKFRDHHWRFWNDDRDLFGWTPEECIETIRGDGALDVVAHPVRYRDKARTRAVCELATGIEVYTSRHKPEVAAEWRAFAEEKRKLWTASADDHQNARYMAPPSGTPVKTLERIIRRPLPMSMILAA